MIRFVVTALICCTSLVGVPVIEAVPQSRGVGVYPGNPEEDFSPSLVAAPQGRRNLALHRAATQSSAYDYNLVAQLVTDGIKQSALPRWLSVKTSTDGELPKHRREFVVDDNRVSGIDLDGPGWIDLLLGGGEAPLGFDRVDIGLVKRNWIPIGPPSVSPACLPGLWGPPVNQPDEDDIIEWSVALTEGGRRVEELGRGNGKVPPEPVLPSSVEEMGKIFNWLVDANPVLWSSVVLDEPISSQHLRIQLEDLECKQWLLAEVRLFRDGERIFLGGPHHFGSAWLSEGLGEEWIAVDLGAVADIDSVALHWLFQAADGEVQVSDDGMTWRGVAEIEGTDGVEVISFDSPVQPRHRVSSRAPTSPYGYALASSRYSARGTSSRSPSSQPAPDANGSVHLAGGGWRLQRESEATGDPRRSPVSDSMARTRSSLHVRRPCSPAFTMPVQFRI